MAGKAADLSFKFANAQKKRAADFFPRPVSYKTFGELRRMESLGEWRFSGVLLHLPLVKRAIPEKLVPQSELICRRLYCMCGV